MLLSKVTNRHQNYFLQLQACKLTPKLVRYSPIIKKKPGHFHDRAFVQMINVC